MYNQFPIKVIGLVLQDLVKQLLLINLNGLHQQWEHRNQP